MDTFFLLPFLYLWLGGQYQIMVQNGPGGRGEILVANWGEIKIISKQNHLLFPKKMNRV